MDYRFNPKAVAFLKQVFEQLLTQHLLETSDIKLNSWMDTFTRVLVKDGTRFDLPAGCAGYFQGFGGSCTSTAGICIQFEYDLKSTGIHGLTLTSANIPDCKNAVLTIDEVQKGDLIIRDLGYYILDNFEQIIKKEAYFISKLHTNTVVYIQNKNKEFEVLDFKKIRNEMQHHQQVNKEMTVWLGISKKVPVRLLIELLPDQVINERIRKIKKNSCRKGWNIRDSSLDRQHFNLIITNIEAGILPVTTIMKAYKLRWQIELIFKEWKSTFKININSKMKYERWMCLFYAKLIALLVQWKIMTTVLHYKYGKTQKFISIIKCLRFMRQEASLITSIIKAELEEKIKLLTYIIGRLLERAFEKEKRKKRYNAEEIMLIRN